MPKQITEDDLLQQGWQQLSDILLSMHSPKDMQTILQFLLSEEEAVQLSKRMLLIQRLIEGRAAQRHIAKELSMSLATITRCSNLLKQTPEGIKNKFRQLASS
jgi:TrpR family trp operon transcriptional repressor